MADEIDDDYAGEVMGKWHHVRTFHTECIVDHSLTSREVRSVLSKMTAVASLGVSVTSNAKYLALAGVGGAAALGAGTAGVGLLVAGGVMTAVGVGTSAASAYKTNKHIDNLLAIQRAGARRSRCRCISNENTADMGNDHMMIYDVVLPYIIAKKRAKLGKKAAGTFGLSMATSAHRLGKAIYKGVKGTKGVNRSFYSHILTRHALTHQCPLAEAIISELFNHTDYIALMNMHSEYAGPLIAGKMKSI